MAIMRYQPWPSVGQLQNEINRLFSNLSDVESSGETADWVPAVDINEHEDRFELFVDLPGVDPKNVDIMLENGVLVLSGDRFAQALKESEQVIERRRERGTGRFYRRFILPETVDADKVKATEKHGVLEISIPKQARAMPRKIEIAA